MSKHSAAKGSDRPSRFRSLFAFRHQSRVGRLVSIVAAFGIAMLLIVGIGPAYAVHDTGMFELDGNTVNDGNATYDWNDLFNSSGGTIATVDPNNGPLLAAGFHSDTATPDTSYFTSSDKDGDAIGSWSCGSANNPLDKDDLQHAYAALVHIPGDSPDTANRNHDVLYLGSDRLGNKGDAFAGFWLLKDPSVGCTSGSFSGHHTDGDLLIVSDYTNGGAAEHVTVYKWVGDDATGGPVLDADYNPSQCSASVSNDNACADANDDTIDAPWRSGIAANEFVESGIDMTHLLDGHPGCFSTFLAETRTSQSIDAELKDFTAGQFNTCPPPPIVTTATPGGGLVAPGTAQHDEATVQAVGSRPTPTGSVKFFLCQPADVTAAGCPSGSGTQVGAAAGVTLSGGSASSVNTTNDTTPGKYCWRAEYAPDATGSNSYVASSHTNATTECFTVVHGSPDIATQISGATGGGAPGLGFTHLGDQATLSNFVGSVTGETVTFNLYGPYAAGVTPTCTGDAIATRTGTLNAAGVATTSSTYDPVAAGTYVWVASYPGDTLNDPATGRCSDATERVTVVGAHIDVTKSANPPGPVSAGTDIGFDITVSNSGAVPAQGATVTDVLPNAGDLNWSLNPAYAGCSIGAGTGANTGHQVLSCSLDTVGAGTIANPTTLPVIHVQSSTSPADCGIVSNTATVATTNGTGEDSDAAHVTVLCPGIHIAKSADAVSVNVGSPIGFTVTAANTGAGSASGVLVKDVLPVGPGITWSIDTVDVPPTGPLSCSIDPGTGVDFGHQVLICTGTLGADQSEVVHVTSPTEWTGSGDTEVNSCLGGTEGSGVYDNTAEISASNADSPSPASAQEQVLCPDLHVTKAADSTAVAAGAPIGFMITATNTGAGSATGALIHDPLPGTVTWTIDQAKTSGPLTCTITTGTLSCSGTLGSGGTETVHVTAATSAANCGTYDNTATLTATNSPQAPHSSATTSVICPIVAPPIVEAPHPNVLPNTGGPDEGLLAAGLALLLGGAALVMGDRRRRHRS